MFRMMALITAVALCGAAQADETWNSTTAGNIVWETDIAGVTVFSFDKSGYGQRARLYLPGLPDSMDDRGTYFGYWIDPAEGDCPARLTGVDGLQSTNWGSAIIAFDNPTFPSGWTAVLGDCMNPPYFGIRADLP